MGELNWLSLGGAPQPGRRLSNQQCDFWRLSADSLIEIDCYQDGSHYVLFEFWRQIDADVMDTRDLDNVFFVLARGLQPNLTMYTLSGGNSKVIVAPPPNMDALPYTGPNGTLTDKAGLDFSRPYQRILVPANAAVSDGGKATGTRDWFVTVANIKTSSSNVGRQETDFRYSVRASCYKADAVPCPKPAPDAEECNGKGTCGTLPDWANVTAPALNKVCYCSGDWGDFACQTPVTRMQPGSVDWAELPAQSWAYWQVSVPRPPSGFNLYGTAPPAFLVELSRTYVGPGHGKSPYYFGNASSLEIPGQTYSGEPILVVMPKGVGDANRLPSTWGDVRAYADLQSALQEQNLHFILYRDLPVTFPATPRAGKDDTSEFYIAVFNNDGSSNKQANVTIRVRWRIDTSQAGPLCPGDCFGRGACYDPQDTTSRPPPPLLPAPPGDSMLQPDFQCGCQQGFGGLLCEGPLSNLYISTGGDGGQSTLQPGQWSFFVLNIDSKRFDYRSNDINIQWVVRDLSSDSPKSYSNAFVTIDMQRFPRGPQPLTTDGYRLGWQVYYSSLTQSSNNPLPMLLKGADLRPGYTYVMGMYNSDYQRQVPYDYGLWLYVPSSPRTWLHPYMSVVLGVTASIIICLLLTLCRRLVQRYGWGPFRPREDPEALAVGQGPNGARVQVGPARPRGVPGSIIDSFHSYEYTASKAQKQQLTKSNRDQQHQQDQGQGVQRPGTAGRGGAQAAAPPATATATVPGAAADGAAAAATATATVDTTVTMAAAAAPELPRDTVIVDMRAVAGGEPRPGSARAALSGTVGPLAAGGSNGTSAAGEPGSSGGSSSGGGDEDEEPQCAVCLCEYEEGERITRLPCNHEFHCTCITKWLQTHYTCPICRISLLPDEPDAEPADSPNAASAAAAGAPAAGAEAGTDAGAAAAEGAAAAPLGAAGRRESRRRSRSLTNGAPPGAPAGAARSEAALPQADAQAQQPSPPPPPPPPSRREMDGVAAAQQQRPGGFMGRFFGGLRRGPRSGSGGAAAAAAPGTAAGNAINLSARRQSDSGQAAAPASQNQFTTSQPRGVTESLSSGENSPVHVGTTAMGSQILARGPTATLDSPAAAAASASAAGSAAWSTTSPSGRRHGSSRVAALPPAASMNGWTAAPLRGGALAAAVASGSSSAGGARDGAAIGPVPPGQAPVEHPLMSSPSRRL